MSSASSLSANKPNDPNITEVDPVQSMAAYIIALVDTGVLVYDVARRNARHSKALAKSRCNVAPKLDLATKRDLADPAEQLVVVASPACRAFR